ncbi:MAG: hypothetical protein V8Q93_15105 [Blautia faecis]
MKKRLSVEQIEALQQEWVTANAHKDEAEQLTLNLYNNFRKDEFELNGKTKVKKNERYWKQQMKWYKWQKTMSRLLENMPYEKMTYPVGMLIRAEEEENIVKIGFFFTEILAAGGRRPLYTLFIDKKKDCFIGYDYRLKSWTNKMLDKIEYPNGVKKHSCMWCDSKKPGKNNPEKNNK